MSNNSGKFKVNANPIPFILQQMETIETTENTQESNELAAWKNMMNSMIKFIHASTKLMNTFNQKASDGVLPRFCGMECIPCPSQTGEKQKTNICAAAASQQKAQEKGNQDRPDGDTPKPKNNSADNTRHVSIVIHSDRSNNDNTQEEDPSPSWDDMDVTTPNETMRTNDEETQNTNDTSVGTEKTIDTSDETQTTNDTFDDTRKPDDTKKPDDHEEDSGTKKNCKGKCSCSGKKKPNQLCACPVNSQETADLRDSMAAKLMKAQSEIDGLKNELEKLQFLEYTKNSNTAALYKQIMKDTPDMPTPRLAPAPVPAPAQAQPSCVCSNLISKGFPEPRPMAQSQQARGIPEGRGSPEIGTLYETAQSRLLEQTNNMTASRQVHTSRPTNTSAMKSFNESSFIHKPASRQVHTSRPTNTSAMQSFNESSFIHKPASWEARVSTNAPSATAHSFDDSIYASPTDPRGPYMSLLQTQNDSSYFPSPAATGRNVSRPENIHFGSPSFNNTALSSSGVGLRGNQSQLRRSQTGNATLNWPEFGPSGPSFENIMTSSVIGFPQGNQSQLQGAPQGYPQMRTVECPKYKKPKRKPTSPIPNQTTFDPRYSSQMSGGGNRTMEDQVPFRAIQVMQAAVTVCSPPRTYADNGYDDQEYLDPPCDNFSCGNDDCEN